MKRIRRRLQIRGRRPSAEGFSLLELMIVSLLVAALSIAVLQSLAFALQARLRTQERWRASLQRWNRAAQSRVLPETVERRFRPMASARPIRVQLIEDPEPGRFNQWEVLCAEK